MINLIKQIVGAFLHKSQPTNLKHFLDMKLAFPYEPVPFEFPNAGSYKSGAKQKATNQFRNKKA